MNFDVMKCVTDKNSIDHESVKESQNGLVELRVAVANISKAKISVIKEKESILKEAREKLDFGKLVGVDTIGNVEEIVNDIAEIIEEKEERQ
ncbi:hypothetical protein V6N12_016041 [Hibiscus sabdariffa]|uniref:Uncharacterized protein n=1 Tax=Hibiscus sabdariffa TaxID=183260 RepID=A0ABR2AD62_9ROSI